MNSFFKLTEFTEIERGRGKTKKQKHHPLKIYKKSQKQHMTKFKSLILLEPRKLHHQNQASMNKLSLEKSKDSPKPKYFFMPINQ